MSEQLRSDARLSRALADLAPAAAPSGLRELIVASAQAAPQQRPVPTFLRPFFDANPSARRRSLLIAAALLVAIALAAVAVGAAIERQRTHLSLEPPTDLGGYLQSTYATLADLPAFGMVGFESGDEHHINSDGNGTIRDERLSTNVTRIVSPERVVQLSVDPEGNRTVIELGRSDVAPGVEVGRYMSLGGDCPTTPTYAGLEYVLDRPTHHIRCGNTAFWIDVETQLVLRSAVTDPSAGPAGGSPGPDPSAAAPTWEVTELRFGPQRAELFSLEAPDGYRVVRADDPDCRSVWFADCVEPVPSGATPAPFVTPRPAAGGEPAPGDLDAFAAAVRAAYANVPALAMTIGSTEHVAGDANVKHPPIESRHFADGSGRFRTELADSGRTVYITTGPHIWISYRRDDGSIYWLDDAGVFADHGGVGDIMLGFPETCETDWRLTGADVVRGRTALRIACGTEEYWVDREWLLVVRHESHPADPLSLSTGIEEVVDLTFADQPADLFELPDGAVVDPATPRP